MDNKDMKWLPAYSLYQHNKSLNDAVYPSFQLN